jgi:hypothetical protein
MITDVFIKRYRNPLVGGAGQTVVGVLCTQAAHIIFDDLCRDLELDDAFFQSVNGRLSREIGVPALIGAGTIENCARFLCETFELWNDANVTLDAFFKIRLSFIELVFREAEHRAATVTSGPFTSLNLVRTAAHAAAFKTTRGQQAFNDGYVPTVKRMVDELNIRLRDAGSGLHYHNGLIQAADDTMTQSQIADPFWNVVRDPKWASVDRDIKEAIDRRDTGGRDPAGYAIRALESTIKIISGQKGWTTGNEKGASNFIDHLQAKKNGNFIDGWEADLLRQMFREIRNPIVHGEGSEPPLQLNGHQTNWVIESCMAWIKSLVLRA